MCHIALGNICFISSIVNDNSANTVCIINPFLQLILGQGCSCRIVWQTQVNDIRVLLWKFRYEIIFCRTWHIDHVAPHLCICIVYTCSSCHNVRININRVNRITDSDTVVHRKNLLNITGITLGSIGYKNLIRRDIASSCLIIMCHDGIPQESIT